MNMAINTYKIKEAKKLEEKTKAEEVEMRRELAEKKAKLEEIKDKKYEQYNLQIS